MIFSSELAQRYVTVLNKKDGNVRSLHLGPVLYIQLSKLQRKKIGCAISSVLPLLPEWARILMMSTFYEANVRSVIDFGRIFFEAK